MFFFDFHGFSGDVDVFSTWFAAGVTGSKVPGVPKVSGVSQVQFRLGASHLWVRRPGVSWRHGTPCVLFYYMMNT